MISYRETQPHAELRDFIRCYGELRIDVPARHASEGLLVPDGHLEIAFNLGAPRHDFLVDRWCPRPEVTVDEVVSRAVRIRWLGPTRYVAVKLTRGAGLSLLGLAGEDLTTEPIDGRALPGLAALGERLAGAPDWARRVRHLDEFFRPLAARATVDLLVAATSRHLESRAGGVSIGACAERLGVSIRTLQLRVRERTGLTPKRLAQIVRVRAAIRSVALDSNRPLSTLAHDLRYADQSHFIREFRSTTGEAPTRFFSRPQFVSDLLTP